MLSAWCSIKSSLMTTGTTSLIYILSTSLTTAWRRSRTSGSWWPDLEGEHYHAGRQSSDSTSWGSSEKTTWLRNSRCWPNACLSGLPAAPQDRRKPCGGSSHGKSSLALSSPWRSSTVCPVSGRPAASLHPTENIAFFHHPRVGVRGIWHYDEIDLKQSIPKPILHLMLVWSEEPINVFILDKNT